MNFSWAQIDTVFLDLDGTLLDRYFDDFFWETFVPEVYGRKHGLPPSTARAQLLAVYRSVANTLQWTDLNYWSQRLDLDIASLKQEVSHLVKIRPYVTEFLASLKTRDLHVYLITNAHPEALQIKLERVPIATCFQDIICSQDIGLAKEQPQFWQALRDHLPYENESTLFVDDTEKVLSAAATAGLCHLVHIAKPSSKLPASPSREFPSIASFKELIF